MHREYHRMITAISQITNHLFIGPIHLVDLKELQRLDVTCLINVCTMSTSSFDNENIKYVHLPLRDAADENVYDHFDTIADQINEVFEQGGKTLVCCVAGVSRSASFCLAYLMKYHHKKLRDAFYFMRQKRKAIAPNNGFFEQLIRYEEKLFGKATIAMINISKVPHEECMIPDVFKETDKRFVWLKSYTHLMKFKKK